MIRTLIVDALARAEDEDCANRFRHLNQFGASRVSDGKPTEGGLSAHRPQTGSSFRYAATEGMGLCLAVSAAVVVEPAGSSSKGGGGADVAGDAGGQPALSLIHI